MEHLPSRAAHCNITITLLTWRTQSLHFTWRWWWWWRWCVYEPVCWRSRTSSERTPVSSEFPQLQYNKTTVYVLLTPIWLFLTFLKDHLALFSFQFAQTKKLWLLLWSFSTVDEWWPEHPDLNKLIPCVADVYWIMWHFHVRLLAVDLWDI